MKLSTRSRYGIKALIYLAMHYGEGPIPLKEIAKKEGISLYYLERLVNQLVTAGYLRSTRGVKGGVMLSSHPAEVNIGDIVKLLEGYICLVDCVEDPATCSRADRCAARDLWIRTSEAINEVLSSTTLQDLIEEQIQKESAFEPIYYI
ncbi:MAG: Rrf2 family transcriptional regulator [Actinobacteria bacterium]|nr:Rrf2 family transcriptional regulator [Actinomycetota bacterium]